MKLTKNWLSKHNYDFTSLPDNLTVGGSLNLSGTGIKMYRVITGACEAGTRHFVETNGDKIKEKRTVFFLCTPIFRRQTQCQNRF